MFKVIINTLERRWRRSGVFIANFEYIFIPFSNVSIVDFKQLDVALVGEKLSGLWSPPDTYFSKNFGGLFRYSVPLHQKPQERG